MAIFKYAPWGRHRRSPRGLSLVEMLLVVATIGIVVLIAVPVIGNIRESAKKAAATQNAKMVASMSEALAALGVAHVIPDSMGGVEATARLMREGVIVPEGPFAGERFILSGMRDSEIEEVAAYLAIQYDSTGLRLVFQQPNDQGALPMVDPVTMQICRVARGILDEWQGTLAAGGLFF